MQNSRMTSLSQLPGISRLTKVSRSQICIILWKDRRKSVGKRVAFRLSRSSFLFLSVFFKMFSMSCGCICQFCWRWDIKMLFIVELSTLFILISLCFDLDVFFFCLFLYLYIDFEEDIIPKRYYWCY